MIVALLQELSDYFTEDGRPELEMSSLGRIRAAVEGPTKVTNGT